jgi:hypothetical protein
LLSAGRASIENGEIAVERGEQTHIAGCTYRALCCIAQVLFALNRRYLINEKGALAEASGFIWSIARLSERLTGIWGAIGRTQLEAALSELRRLSEDLHTLVKKAA